MEHLKKRMRAVLRVLALYIDDMLLLTGGACLVHAARLHWGDAAAYAAAGGCLVAYAVLIAWSRKR